MESCAVVASPFARPVPVPEGLLALVPCLEQQVASLLQVIQDAASSSTPAARWQLRESGGRNSIRQPRAEQGQRSSRGMLLPEHPPWSLSRQLATSADDGSSYPQRHLMGTAAAAVPTSTPSPPPSTAPPTTPAASLPPPPPPPIKPLPTAAGAGGCQGASASPHNNGSMWVTFACLTKKGHAPGYKQDNQDSMFVYETFAAPSQSLFGVFDGHGQAGHKVSSFIREQLPPTLQRRLQDSPAAAQPSCVEDALRGTFVAVNEGMETGVEERGRTVGCPGCGGQCGGCRPRCGFDAYNSGSTAVVSYLEGDVLTTAWSGDSRAVMGVERPVTTSNTPNAPLQASASTSASAPGAAAPALPPAPLRPSLASFFASKAHPDTAAAGQEGGASPPAANTGSGATPTTISTAADKPKPKPSSSPPEPPPAPPPSSSPAAYTWHSVELTKDHKPDRPDERRRIMLYGGRVARTYSSSGVAQGPHRVWLQDYDYPGLAMSRALGDLAARPAGIICTPEVSQVVLPSGPRAGAGQAGAGADSKSCMKALGAGAGSAAGPRRCFVVLASDGVWEFMSNKQVVDMVGARLAWQQDRSHYQASNKAGTGSGGGAGKKGGGGLWGQRLPLQAPGLELGAMNAGVGRLGAGVGGGVGGGEVVPRVWPWVWPWRSSEPDAGEARRLQVSSCAAAACRAVAEESLERWTKEYQGQYIDDITVVVAQFEPL